MTQDVADADQGVGGRSRRQGWPCMVTEGSVQRAHARGVLRSGCLAIFNIFYKGAPHCYFAVRPKHSVAGPHSRRKKKESREEEEEAEADGSGRARK